MRLCTHKRELHFEALLIHRLLYRVTVLAALGLPLSASAQSLTVYGGPTFDQTTLTGYLDPVLPVLPGSTAGNGLAVVNVPKFVNDIDFGSRTFRWDASGSAPTELGNLGSTASGATNSVATAVNSVGIVVGNTSKFTGGAYLGERAVRWNASGTAATELAHLGTNTNGSTISAAYAVNTAGTAVGIAHKYAGDTPLGSRAVRWDASGTAITELGNLGTNASGGGVNTAAHAINGAGRAVGYVEKFGDSSPHAVRWDPSGTAATDLGIGVAWTVNSAGTAAGVGAGWHAVRWDASGTAATVLENLTTNDAGYAPNYVYAINDAGTVVGTQMRYVNGVEMGLRAVRWDGSGTAITELAPLVNGDYVYQTSAAVAINGAGATVGWAQGRAILWDASGNLFDLNTLINPASGWTLGQAYGISETNWVTGIGQFDPDGAAGPLIEYNRAFLVNASSVVPEPAGLALLSLGGMALVRRRARRPHRAELE